MVTYTGKLVLAPMVRAGELPTRLLALKYGADLVWGPEIIDKKLLTCERFENKELNCIDYLSKTGNLKKPGVSNLVFRTFPSLENSKLIFQMGTACPDLAVKAANLIIKDVDGIDINAGCPKHFSIHAGMGAALLKTPDILVAILAKLVEEVGKVHNKPISVKIRLLHDKESTMDLVKKLLRTGIANLTLHCRTQSMKNSESPIRDYIPDIIKECQSRNVSFIINGSLKNRSEFNELQAKYGMDVGGMIAEGAETNPSCFSGTPLHWTQIAKECIDLCTKFNNNFGNTKFLLSRFVPGKASVYKDITQAKDYEDVLKIKKMIDDNMDEILEKEKNNGRKRRIEQDEFIKRVKVDNADKVAKIGKIEKIQTELENIEKVAT